jgi:hypothetical protein
MNEAICPNCSRLWGHGISRRALAEKILLKLIEVSPAASMASEEGEGIRLAWQIADAFLKAEDRTSQDKYK